MTHFHIPKDLYHEEGYKQVNGIPHYYRMVGTGLVYVADSGHYPFMEAPSEFFNTLNSFIDGT